MEVSLHDILLFHMANERFISPYHLDVFQLVNGHGSFTFMYITGLALR